MIWHGHGKWVHHHHQWPGHVQHQPRQLVRVKGDSDDWYVLFFFVLSGHWEYQSKAKRARLARAEERQRQAAEEAAEDQECQHRKRVSSSSVV